jgi:alkylation response protein AidB-like acyl-CoA dehydrogenase
MSTTAQRGDTYILNGTKTFITNGSVASLYTVFATRDKSLRHQGIAVHCASRHAWYLHGKRFDKMGQRASDTAEVI